MRKRQLLVLDRLLAQAVGVLDDAPLMKGGLVEGAPAGTRADDQGHRSPSEAATASDAPGICLPLQQ